MSPSDLSRAIAEENWERVVQLAKPEEASVWSKRGGFFDGKTAADVLPLHEALVGHAPYEAVVSIARAYPHAIAATESSYKRLPLHCACRKNADPKVVGFLVEQYKAACLIPDSLGRCPIHYVLTNGADIRICKILIHAQPEVARSVDDRGWTPVHVAVNVGASQEIVQLLLDAYPEATLIRTAKGSSIRVSAEHSPNRAQLEALVKEKRAEVDENVHLPSLQKKPQLDHELS